MENENIYEISKEVENVLYNTCDIETIELILSGVEKALEEGMDHTEGMFLKLPKYNNNGRCYVNLDMTKAQPIVQGFYDRCMEMEEYEICPRIINLLNALKDTNYEQEN